MQGTGAGEKAGLLVLSTLLFVIQRDNGSGRLNVEFSKWETSPERNDMFMERCL